MNALKRADWTPLMLACTKTDKLDTVRLLLDNKAIVECQNKDGWTAMHIACREGTLDVFRLLRDSNADIFNKTKNGRNTLHIAALHGNQAIVEDLLATGKYHDFRPISMDNFAEIWCRFEPEWQR